MLLLSQALGDEEADLVVEVPVVDLLLADHLPHLARVAASLEVDEDYHAVDEQDYADAEQHHQVGFNCRPAHDCSSLDV